MSNTEPDAAPMDGGSGTSSSELWRSPVATLPLWPVALSGGILLFSFVALEPALLAGSRWRGLDLLVFDVLALWWWWRSSRRRGHSVRDVLGPAPTLRQLALMLVATLVAQALRVGWLAWIASRDLVPEYWKAAIERSSSQTGLTPAELLAFVVAGPFLEEILFRGLVFRRSLRRMRPILAALGSSLLFGLCHFDILGSLSFALILVGLYVRSNSLWVPIAAHALFNATASLMGALVEARASLGWAIAGAQLVCVPWLVWFVHRSLRQLRG